MLRKAIMFTALLALIGCSPTGPYQKKDGVWHFENAPIDVPAGETLNPLNRRWARSETVAFFRDSRIDGAHAASFEALSDHYAKDRARVYWGDTYRKGQEYYTIVHNRVAPISGADAATFTVLRQDYAKDKARVYYEGSPIAADAATFELLDNGFARDTNTGFYLTEPIAGSDGKTFTVIDNEWSKDAGRVFWSDMDLSLSPPAVVSRMAEGADPRTFQALEEGYGRDGSHVWFHGQVVQGADPASFAVVAGVDGADAKDRFGTYREGRSIRPAPAAADDSATDEEAGPVAEPTAEP